MIKEFNSIQEVLYLGRKPCMVIVTAFEECTQMYLIYTVAILLLLNSQHFSFSHGGLQFPYCLQNILVCGLARVNAPKCERVCKCVLVYCPHVDWHTHREY